VNRAIRLDDIAGAILDGMPVDWSLVDEDDVLIEQLKTLETLRRRRRPTAATGASGGFTWGHLQVSERIGHGAYGDVYKAWDTRLDREVALKLLPVDDLGTSSALSSIIEEGRLLARVRHPNVVTIYGAERIDSRAGLWMELVKGRTLEECLRAGRTFTGAEATRLGVELCQAVSAVHAAGLLHRDIKAQNIMLDDSGRLVLMDFGTGGELTELAETMGGRIAGTPLYLAPEIFAGGTATHRSDVYSIGVVLFRLLTNSYPVSGTDLADLRRAHGGEGAVNPADWAAIPRALRQVLARALDRDPERRYASADAFREALAAAERRPSRTGRSLVAAVALLLVTGIASWNVGLRDRLVAIGVLAKDPTIVVLPFTDAGSDPGHAGFAEGLTNQFSRDLANIEGLQVIGETSSLYFKDRPRDLQDVTKQLQADFAVEASVQRIGNRLRLDASLVRLPDQAVEWSYSYDREFKDVLAIQDEISLAIVNKLRLKLGGGQRRYYANVEAYDLYLQALGVRNGTGEGRGPDVAKKLFERVIEIDRTFAPAWAGLATVYQPMFWNVSTAGWAGMGPAARKAIELDPFLPEAHAAMGLAYAYERDWKNATNAFERALEGNPNLTQIHAAYSDALVLMGQPDRALELLERAIELDPLSLFVLRDLAYAQFLNRDFEASIANYRRIEERDPDFMGDLLTTRALMMAGEHEKAIELYESKPANAEWERWLARAYFATGRQTDLARLIAKEQKSNSYQHALVFAGIGDKEQTFESLFKAANEPGLVGRVAGILFAPEMAFLRDDARFDELRRILKLPVER
jgi:TolB-like protein/Tfp pilus assembly protein PilF